MWGRFLTVCAFCFLCGALAFSEYSRRATLHSVHEDLEQARELADTVLSTAITAQTLEQVDRSVYQIQIFQDGEFTQSGTAFVIDRDRGVLGTNAHVAEAILDGDPKTESVLAKDTMSGKIPVKTARLHAGYDAFRKLVEEYGPIRKGSPLKELDTVIAHNSAFDAALLFVDPIDPETGENRLGPNLPIASQETLLGLKKAAPIAIVGFPMGRVDDSHDEDAPTSRLVRGVISNIHGPFPGMAAAPAEVRNFIAHRLDSTFGNSGSPVVNAKGEVIGVHTYGNVQDKLAVRADAFNDMLTPLGEEETVYNIYMPAWREALSQWARADEVMPHYIRRLVEPSLYDNGEQLTEDVLKDAAPLEVDVNTIEFSRGHGKWRPFIVPADDLLEDTNPERPGVQASTENGLVKTPIFRVNNTGDYVRIRTRLDPDKNTVLFAYDFAVTGNAPLCRMKLFARRYGDEAYIESGYSLTPYLKIDGVKEAGDAREAENGVDASDDAPPIVDVIVFRPGYGGYDQCDYWSGQFSFGVLELERDSEKSVNVARAHLDLAAAGNAPSALFKDGVFSRGAQLTGRLGCMASNGVNHFTCKVSAPVAWTGETMTLKEIAAHKKAHMPIAAKDAAPSTATQ